MNPVGIASALEQIEDGKDLLRSSVELFWKLFAKDSYEFLHGKVQNDEVLRDLQDIRSRGQAITTTEMSVLALLDPVAFAERLPERLREVTERLTPRYQSDEPGDPEALFVAAHLRASRLAFYLIQSAAGQNDRLFDYGEDAGLYVRDLEELIARLKISMSRRGSPREFPEVYAMSVWSIESLAERVGAELAEQRGDYPEALERLANALTVAAPMREINEAWEHSENPEELVDLAQACPWRKLSRAVDSGLWYSWTPGCLKMHCRHSRLPTGSRRSRDSQTSTTGASWPRPSTT